MKKVMKSSIIRMDQVDNEEWFISQIKSKIQDKPFQIINVTKMVRPGMVKFNDPSKYADKIRVRAYREDYQLIINAENVDFHSDSVEVAKTSVIVYSTENYQSDKDVDEEEASRVEGSDFVLVAFIGGDRTSHRVIANFVKGISKCIPIEEAEKALEADKWINVAY